MADTCLVEGGKMKDTTTYSIETSCIGLANMSEMALHMGSLSQTKRWARSREFQQFDKADCCRKIDTLEVWSMKRGNCCAFASLLDRAMVVDRLERHTRELCI